MTTSKMKTGEELAFPSPQPRSSAIGLTKREYYALMILSGIVANSSGNYYGSIQDAVRCADLLIEELGN